MYEFANLAYDRSLLLLLVVLLPDDLEQLDIDGKRAYDEIDGYVDGVVHHLSLIDGPAEVLLAVPDPAAVEVDETVVVADLHELLVADHEPVTCHLEYVHLLADQTGQLSRRLPFALVRGC